MTPLLRETMWELRSHRKDISLDLIFCTTTGKPIRPRWLIRKQFEPTLKRAGLKRIRFHDLRHTYVALAIHQGAHPKFIQHQLGHASIQTTLDRYGHWLQRDGENIGLRLDQIVSGSASSEDCLAKVVM
jgi:integrase